MTLRQYNRKIYSSFILTCLASHVFFNISCTPWNNLMLCELFISIFVGLVQQVERKWILRNIGITLWPWERRKIWYSYRTLRWRELYFDLYILTYKTNIMIAYIYFVFLRTAMNCMKQMLANKKWKCKPQKEY